MKQRRSKEEGAQPLCKSCENWGGYTWVNCLHDRTHIAKADMPISYCCGYEKRKGGKDEGKPDKA